MSPLGTHSITDFSVIEQNKENIKPISQGRSANKLQELIKLDKHALSTRLSMERQKFEQSIAPEVLADSDDPLESYLSYIRWIRETYTTGNTTDSELIQLLERTTHDFKDDLYYKNEVRYFKIWLEYIEYSDTPGDVFNYLFKKQIGSKLSLFYENYALYYEANSQWDKAFEIYQIGLKSECRPEKRLIKSFEEFRIRKERIKLSVTSNESFKSKGLLNPTGGGLTVGNGRSRDKKQKVSVFVDEERIETSDPNNSNWKWDELDSIQNVKKENIPKSSCWNGETLKQEKINPKATQRLKLEVFNDNSLKYPVTKIIRHPNGKRTEKFDFNFSLFFTNNGPKTILEVLTDHQQKILAKKPQKRALEEQTKTPITKKKRASLTPAKTAAGSFIFDYLQDESKLTQSPTLTFFSKQAQTDVFKLFNQSVSQEHQDKTADGVLESGLSDFVTETITNTINKVPSNTILEIQSGAKSNVNEEFNLNDDLLSSPFMENPAHEEARREPVIVNPFDKRLQINLINRLNPKICEFKNYHSINVVMDKLSTLQKIFKPNAAPIMGNKQSLIEFEKDKLYCVTKELGRGGFAVVYLSEKYDGCLNAIKVESPSNDWEFYILSRLAEKTCEFIKIESFYKFRDESYLILPYLKQGTVLDLVNVLNGNILNSSAKLLDEPLAIYLTIQLLRKLLKLHSLGFIHGDLKPDNCMLNFHNSEEHLSFQDLILIDFGRSIDLSLHPVNTQFQTVLSVTDSQDCPELKLGDPWCYQTDYYGAATVIHTLLFGKVISLRYTSTGIFLAENIKRYWQKNIWDDLFNLLLNSKKMSDPFSTGNISNKLEISIGELETWFNCNVDQIVFLRKLNEISEFLDNRFKKFRKL